MALGLNDFEAGKSFTRTIQPFLQNNLEINSDKKSA